MKKLNSFLLLPAILPGLLVCLNSQAQTPDWSTDLASIIYSNCASCHHENAIGPFSLMSYDDAVANGSSIKEMVAARKMPPWPADPDYRHFAYEAVLSEEEINSVIAWVDQGMPSGDLTQAPVPPEFPSGGSQLKYIDDTVQIEPYEIQFNTDEYRYFVVPGNHSDTIYINQIEVIAGIPSAVHHADIYYDASGQSQIFDQQDPLSGFNSGTGWPATDYYINAWQPGGNVVTYPDGWGIMVPPGADYVLEIHYGPGHQGMIDDTRMHLRFVTDPVDVRPVKVEWTLYDSPPCLQDGPLLIAANEVGLFHQKSYAMPQDRSLLAICPHMHLLGQSYRVWYKTTDGDSVPLIDIPQWDFHWQKYYYFEQVLKIPQGARIYSEGVFDNTINNPNNPNNPPQTISKGPTTEDEMFLTYFIFSEYEPGDENLWLDSTQVSPNPEIAGNETPLHVFPNPSSDQVWIYGSNPGGGVLKWKLYDGLGRQVTDGIWNDSAGWIREPLEMKSLAPGVYILRIQPNRHPTLYLRMVRQ